MQIGLEPVEVGLEHGVVHRERRGIGQLGAERDVGDGEPIGRERRGDGAERHDDLGHTQIPAVAGTVRGAGTAEGVGDEVAPRPRASTRASSAGCCAADRVRRPFPSHDVRGTVRVGTRTVARHVCLREPHRTPTLPSDAPSVAAVGELGECAEDLVLLVAGLAPIRVDEMPLVAAALGRSTRETGCAADRLVEEGIRDERHGELVVRCPAVGATLLERAGAGRVRALHASVALAATTPVHGDLVPLGRGVLADHVAAAGDRLAPEPRWGPLLRGQARENQHYRPARAGRFLLAAWYHDAGGHAPAGTTEWTLRFLLRVGDHEGVGRVVADVVAAGGHESGSVDRRLLAASASVAALTCRRRVPAADIATWQGKERAVDAWQEYLPDQATRCLHPVLHTAVFAARLWATGDAEAALAHGWRTWKAVGPGAFALAIDRRPRPLSRVVARRTLLTRLCGIAAVERCRQWYPRLLSAAEEWCRVARGAEASDARETRDLVRGVLGDGAPDCAALERTVQRARERGHLVELTWLLLTAGAASPDPAASWSEAYTIAKQLRAPVPRARLRRLMDEHGVRPPRPRPSDFTEVQMRIVELVEQGMTNQIARRLRVSEKTVENHLTRLFVRFGCRNRHGLATARLAARRDDLKVRA